MTVEEFYKYCKANRAETFDIEVADISRYGCYVGQKDITPEHIYIDYDVETVNV